MLARYYLSRPPHDSFRARAICHSREFTRHATSISAMPKLCFHRPRLHGKAAIFHMPTVGHVIFFHFYYSLCY